MSSRFFFIFLFSSSIFSQSSEYSILNMNLSLTNNSNAVLVEEKIEIDVSNPSKVIRSIKKAVCVLNEKGDSKVNSYAFYDDDVRIKKIELYIYDALGNEVNHIKRSDFKDNSAADGFSLYNDDRVLYYDYTPQKYPYTAVFEVETVSRTTAFLPSWRPVLGYASSTKQSEFVLTFDPENKPNYKAENVEGYNISIEETPSQFIAKASQIPAISYEEHAPDYSNYAPKVSFALKNFKLKGVDGNGDSWLSFGKWMQDQLLSGTDDLPQSTINEVQGLVAATSSQEEKARIIYQYVQDKVRYISIQIGIGGWKPMLASDVDTLSYGDCKALTNYTKALLDAVGVPSYYTVLHSDTTEKDFSKDFVAIQGNHAILGVPNEDQIIWLECTSQDLPFGFVPNANDNRDVLIITDEGGKIVRTKSYTPQENKQKTNASIQLTAQGGMEATIEVVSNGLQYGNVFRLENKNDTEVEMHYKKNWNNINALNIQEARFNNNKREVVFTENVTITTTNYCTPIGEDYLLTINNLNVSTYIPPRMKEREKEIEISVGFWDEDVYQINIPLDFVVESLPDDQEITTPFGSYTINFKMDDNKLIYTRSKIINKGIYPANSYEEFRSFYKTMAKLDKTKILLTKKR